MEPYLHHAPGLTVVTPGTASDAAGLLRSSLRCGEPVVFLEHRRVYDVVGDVPADPDFVVPLGTAEVVTEGNELTIVAWGWMRQEAEAATRELQGDGVSVCLIDPRTIRPFDWEAVIRSVAETGRLLVVEESPITGSVAGELVARVAESSGRAVRFNRHCMPDVIHPYSATLEGPLLPSRESILAASHQLLRE